MSDAEISREDAATRLREMVETHPALVLEKLALLLGARAKGYRANCEALRLPTSPMTVAREREVVLGLLASDALECSRLCRAILDALFGPPPKPPI